MSMSLCCACSSYTRRQSHLNSCSMTQGLACPNAALTLDKHTISYKLHARFRSGRTVPGHRAPCVNVAKPQAEPSTNARRAAVSPAQTRPQSKQTKRKEGNLSLRRPARSCCQTEALKQYHKHLNYRCPRSSASFAVCNSWYLQRWLDHSYTASSCRGSYCKVHGRCWQCLSMPTHCNHDVVCLHID